MAIPELLWEYQASQFGGLNVLDVTWSPELEIFVSVGGIASGNPILATSPDGKTWTLRASSFPNANFIEAVAWSPSLNLFVALGRFASLATSPDGINWTFRGNDKVFTQHSVLRWFSELAKFFVGGSGGIGTSVDGITWSAIDVSPENWFPLIHDIGWSPELGLLVAVGWNQTATASHPKGSVIVTSPDGATWNWTERAPGLFGVGQSGLHAALSVVWSSDLGMFVVGGRSGKLATSPDGINWTLRNTYYVAGFAGSPGINSIVWAPEIGTFITSGEWGTIDSGGSSLGILSGDGVNWVHRPYDGINFLPRFASFWSPSLKMVVAAGNQSLLETGSLSLATPLLRQRQTAEIRNRQKLSSAERMRQRVR